LPSTSWLGWWGPIRESYPGAWQQNVTLDPPTTLLRFSAVYACVTGIAGDIGKLRIKLVRETENDIWTEVRENEPWLPVLRKPNHYQTRIKFIEAWIVSKLLAGNAYILKQREDLRGIVTALYPLNPACVTPLIADNGDVYYELRTEALSQLGENVTVPASEIIHDPMVPLFHQLVGVSPLYACAISATMGNRIQSNSTAMFANALRPGGVLTAPGHISDASALKLKEQFETGFTGSNVGRLAVLGDGLKFEPMVLTAEASQLAEQLDWTVADVGRAFHYPQWKLGGAMPPYSNGPEAVTTQYYTDCLQELIECVELSLDEGLEFPKRLGTEMDLDNLMRMDTRSLYEANNLSVTGGWGTPDEARRRANLPPVEGGNTPYLQQQNYSLAALAKRDAQADPFASAKPPAPNPPERPSLPARGLNLEDLEFLEAEMQKELVCS
jgi:HK97 family phage portal protein